MKAAVVQFPGSNCEWDTVWAIEIVTGNKPVLVWHKDRVPLDTDLVVLPGGFSYGDYLRAGAIARFSPVMQSVIDFAGAGGLVLGICNGFQILLESGLLPGGMLRNKHLHFVCKWVYLRCERHDLPFSNAAPDVIRLPIAHAQGNYYAAPELLRELERDQQILFRYCDERGNVCPAVNPNGSVGEIAGIVNKAGNVLGMMPHPERAVDPELGGTDGRFIFESIGRWLSKTAAS